MKSVFPATIKRVEMHTDEYVNNKIMKKTYDNILEFSVKSENEIKKRIKELDADWDIERMLETNAASAVIASITLGITINKKWFLLSGGVGGFLLQHALQAGVHQLKYSEDLA